MTEQTQNYHAEPREKLLRECLLPTLLMVDSYRKLAR